MQRLWLRFLRPVGVIPALVTSLCVADGLAAEETTVSQGLSAATTATAAQTSGTTVAASLQFMFVANSPTSFWKLARSGADKAARELGASVDFLVTVEGSAREQKDLVDLALSHHLDGLAFAPAVRSLSSAAEEIDRASQAMPVITVGIDVPASKRRCYVGSDQYYAGQEAGRALGGIVKTTSSSKIGIIAGLADDPVVRERLRGVRQELGARFSLVGPVFDSGDDKQAEANVVQMLDQNPDLAGMVGISRHDGPAIARVLENRPMPAGFRVVCFDEELATVAAISDGRIYASVVEDPFEIGYRAVSLLVSLARGEPSAVPDQGIVNTDVKVLRAGGIGTFIRKLTTRSKRTE